MSTKSNTLLAALLLMGGFFSSAHAVYMYKGTLDTTFYTGGTYTETSFIYSDPIAAGVGICTQNNYGVVYNVSGSPYCVIPSDTFTGVSYEVEVPAGSSQSQYCEFEVAPDGTCATPTDCSTNTNAMMLTVSQDMMALASDGVFDVGGCGYFLSSVQCIDVNTCLGVATGTGVSVSGGVTCDALCQTEAQGTATTEMPLVFEIITDPVSAWDKVVDTVINLDESITDTITTTTHEANEAWDSITYDGEYFNELVSSQSTSDQVKTDVITTQLDGSSQSTETAVTTNTSGGSDLTITFNDGTTTITSTVPVSNTTTTITNTTYNSEGDIIAQDSTSDTELDDVTDPNDPSAVPSSDDFANGDLTEIESLTSGFSASPDTSLISKPTLLLLLNSGGQCSNEDFSFEIFGSYFNPDLCTYIQMMQDILYWLLYMMTAIFAYSSLTRMGSVKH